MSAAGIDGRTALVTGGGTGIGAAIAVVLAGAGAKVTIAGRRREPLEGVAAGHDRISVHPVDVTEEDSVAALFDDEGPFDIVVANAGAVQTTPARRTSLQTWDTLLAVNLTGVFLTLRAALQAPPRDGYGRLIAVASTAGLKGYPYVAAYCAAKHGVVGLVRSLAQETAGSGRTVNAVCPGFTDTPMLDASVQTVTAATGRDPEDALSELIRDNPSGRPVHPEEVAAVALWLCGSGSDMVTGQAIAVDGGETA